MDINLGSYFYSSSKNSSGNTLYLHFTGSANVPVNQQHHEISLVSGLATGTDRRVAFYSGSTTVTTAEGFVVDHSGSVGIGINELNDLPVLSHKLFVSGSVGVVALFQTSDARTKHNVETVQGALSRIISSRGVTFDRNNGKKEVGVIAQEIQNTIPEVIHEDTNGLLSVNYSGIIGVLIEAIKEQEARISILEQKLAEK
jgi:hypothetical protein